MTLNRVYISEKDCMFEIVIVRVLKNNIRTWVSSLGPFWGSEPVDYDDDSRFRHLNDIERN